MLALPICFAAFILTLWLGRRSLYHGLLALLVVGYAYGITRANLPVTASHFIFDSSLIGLYLSQRWTLKPSERVRVTKIQIWAIALIGWCVLLCFLPIQNFWITLVGFRGNAILLPLILLGTRLRATDLRMLSCGLAILNFVALGFAVAQYFLGIEMFFPRNEVTQIIYNSNDLAGGAYRIPSVFMSAHSYGGAMVITLPWLFGSWMQRNISPQLRTLMLAGMGAALLGILLTGTRLNFVVAALLIFTATFTSGLSLKKQLGWIAALAIVAYIASGNERLQRFTTLQDTSEVSERVAGSNVDVIDTLLQYPLGNGLGGGGSSLPYFLQDQVKNPVAIENEYARISLEQGLIGLFLWLSFLIWHLQNRTAFLKSNWLSGRRLGWVACTICFGTGFIGTGLFTAIPQSVVFLLILGWVSTPPLSDQPETTDRNRNRPNAMPQVRFEMPSY